MRCKYVYIWRMKKDVQIAVRVPLHLKLAIAKVADEERRSMSSQIEKVLVDWLRSIGRYGGDNV